MPDLNAIPLHDEQDPTVLTDAGIALKEMKKRYRKTIEKAVVRHIMEAYEARCSATSYDFVRHSVEAQASHTVALALLDTAEENDIPCRSIERLDRIARRKLRHLINKGLKRTRALMDRHTRQQNMPEHDWMQERQNIWVMENMLHLLEEPMLNERIPLL